MDEDPMEEDIDLKTQVDNIMKGDFSSLKDDSSLEPLRHIDPAIVLDASTPQAVAQAVETAIEGGGPESFKASAAYAAILASPGAPTNSLYNTMAFSGCLRALKSSVEVSAGASSRNASQIPSGMKASALIHDLSAFSANASLQDADTFRPLADAFTRVLASAPDEATRSAAATALENLISEAHGGELSSAAALLRRLGSVILSTQKGSHRSNARSKAIAIAERVPSSHPNAEMAVSSLARHLCVQCPDSAAGRSAAVDAVPRLIQQLPVGELHSFCGFVVKLSKTSSAAKRHTAAEMAPKLINAFSGAFEDTSTSTGPQDVPLSSACRDPWGVTLASMLASRASDKALKVRVKAIKGLRSCFSAANSPGDRAALLSGIDKALASCKSAKGDAGSSRTPESGLKWATAQAMKGGKHKWDNTRRDGLTDDDQDDEDDEVDTASPNNDANADESGQLYHETRQLEAIVRRRCRDAKGNARKASLNALEVLCISRGEPADRRDITTLLGGCKDELVSVRKQAVASLGEVLTSFEGRSETANAWVSAVAMLTGDSEQSAQEACADLLERIFFGPLERSEGKQKGDGGAIMAVLSAFGQSSSGGACAKAAVAAMSRRKRVTDGLVKSLIGIAEDAKLQNEAKLGTWLILAEAAEVNAKPIKWHFLKNEWEACKQNTASSTQASVLRAMSAASSAIPSKEAAKLADEIRRRITSFNLHLSSAAPHMSALASLSRSNERRKGRDESQGKADEWAVDVCGSAASVIGAWLEGQAKNTKEDAERVVCALHAAGEAALADHDAPTETLKNSIQAMVAGKEGSSGKENGPVGTPTAHMQAHAWTALGKLCVGNEQLASRSIPLLAREVREHKDPIVRNNILVVLADLCVAHTVLVDPYSLRLAACIRDTSALVRRQALSLIGSLMQRDYVKCRTPLYVRCCRALADESQSVRRVATNLVNSLSLKSPTLAHSNVVEVLFAINGTTEFNDSRANDPMAGATQAERNAFSIPGSSSEARQGRLAVLQTLLRSITPEHRLAAAARLSDSILSATANDEISVENNEELISDTLALLATREAGMLAPTGPNSRRQVQNEEEDDDNEGTASQSSTRGTGIVPALAAKHFEVSVLPVYIELDSKFKAMRSPLSGALLSSMRLLMNGRWHDVDRLLGDGTQICKQMKKELHASQPSRPPSATPV